MSQHSVRRLIPVTMVAVLPLIMPVSMAWAQGGDAAARIEDRLDRLEQKLDRLLELLQPPPAGPVVPPAAGRAGSSPDRAPPVAGKDPGWAVTVYRVSPSDFRARGQRIGEYQSAAVQYRFDAYRRTGALSDAPPVGEERNGIFTASEAGWYRFAIELDFPARGFAGYLAGFVCQVEIHLNGDLLVEQMVRMPYSLSNRTKSTSGTAILQSGPHHIGTYIGCVPDGRNNADPVAALDAVEVRVMIKRPSDRWLRVAEAADFFVPATE